MYVVVYSYESAGAAKQAVQLAIGQIDQAA
jgi:hypothetical protein